MLTSKDFINIFLPILSHWIIWLIFSVIVIIFLSIYIYPYIRKPKKEFNNHHVAIPLAGVVSLYIFTKMLEGVIYQGSILKVDERVNEFFSTLYSPLITKVASFITAFGSTIVIILLFILALTVLIVKKRWRYAILSTIVILGALILQVSIKVLVHRIRPENLLVESTFSFPSGHANMAIAFVSLLIYSFKDDFKNKAVRYVLIISSISFFLAVGISRIILHVHWFSDVVAGISLGLFWFMLVVLVERAIPGLVKEVRIETKEAKPIIP